jgi:hypothetical protein
MPIYRHDYLICLWRNEEGGCRIEHLYKNSLSFVSQGVGGGKCRECRMPEANG